MSSERKLLDLGATCVGGDLILRHQTVGRYRNGDFYPTDEGLAAIEREEQIEDAVVVTEPKPAKPTKTKAKPAPEPVPAADPDPAGDLDLDLD